ncbi:RDD family protein [Spongiactinospora sp. TRM90649]|uniref:RDD family protein n=1 Tax=Spongiactinospora sp. TRM90649 TaxID=3031114 RepID=UPI0023F8B6C5|nr:RDD family protein [Spongiactinospora sp. TRM90649]MDF5751382.1 RDD family protein [Spongiactinospora sp. TRM90649]
MSDVVIGEAVVVEVRHAQLPSRAVAVFIDLVVQFVLLVGANLLLENIVPFTDLAMLTALSILLSVLVVVGYPVAFETLSRGRSLGKLAMGLRVVSDDGGPERFRQALFRGLAGVLEFYMFLGAPALISSLVSERGKRLGDVFAGTVVISERAPRDRSLPAAMPPQLAAWASRLELSALPGEVASTARQYLARWYELSPNVRHEMGVRIATQVSAYVSPPPPPGVPPHAYLSAVLAERHRREGMRLARQAQQSSQATQAQFTQAQFTQSQFTQAQFTQAAAMPYGGPAPAPTYPAPAQPYGPQGGYGHGAQNQGQVPGNTQVSGQMGGDPAGPTPGGFVPPA